MSKKAKRAPSGNYVSEWYAHRTYPTVNRSPEILKDQQDGRCPMLSAVTGESRQCIKGPASHGICTISSAGSGVRHDWLVCPFRALDPHLLDTVVRRLYRLEPGDKLLIISAPRFAREADREQAIDAIRSGTTVVAYLQDKLGGEISVSPSPKSPELSFDITTVQITERPDGFHVGRYGILEVQTVDFHGSYRHATKNLKDALRLYDDGFHAEVERNQRWLSDHVESPNVANVFKRTFYQMVFKFQIGADESCAGCALAIPVGVWESWQKHLAGPTLATRPDGLKELRIGSTSPTTPAWIYVFDIDQTSSASPNQVRIIETIATDAEAIMHYALKLAPAETAAGAGSADRILSSIRRRLAEWWPGLRA
jgi:hypothetical protein